MECGLWKGEREYGIVGGVGWNKREGSNGVRFVERRERVWHCGWCSVMGNVREPFTFQHVWTNSVVYCSLCL